MDTFSVEDTNMVVFPLMPMNVLYTILMDRNPRHNVLGRSRSRIMARNCCNIAFKVLHVHVPNGVYNTSTSWVRSVISQYKV